MQKLLSVVGLCFLAMVFAGGPDEGKGNSPEKEPSDLKTAFADLSKKVAELEKRIEKLEASQRIAVIGSTMVPDRQRIPESWRQREFNGMSYYIVPLDEGKTK